MSTPDANTQSKSTSPDVLAEQLIALTDRLQRRLRPSYHVTQLTPARLSALSAVVSKGRCNVGQIAQAEQVTAPTITRILDGLEASGFITRTPSKRDRRIVEVQATRKGRNALEKAKASQVRGLADNLKHLTPANLTQISEALQALQDVTENDRR